MIRGRRGRGEIVKIKDLFEVYRKRLKAPQDSVISAFCEVVEDVMGFKIKKDYITYSPFTRTLTIKGSGQLKTEIFLQKKEILTHLKGRLGEKSAPTEIL